MSDEKIVKEDLCELARALGVEENGTRRQLFERCLEKARAARFVAPLPVERERFASAGAAE